MPDPRFHALADAASLAREQQDTVGADVTLAAVAECLTRLVPADLVAWNDVDLDAWRTDVRTYSDGRHPDSREIAQVLETVGDNPMVMSYVRPERVHDLAPRRLSDLVSDIDLHRTRSYAAVFKPLSGDHQLTALSSRTARRHGRVWGFNRASSDFTDAEVDVLRMIQPLLAIIERLIDAPPRPPVPSAAGWGLTEREAEIVTLLARGLTADAIASLCGISGATVRKHLEHAYAKLGCHDKVTAVGRFLGEEER